jgi:hypothetical protein
MKDFVSIDIESQLDRMKVLQVCAQQLPEFSWRTGESDALGGYVTGTNKDHVQIKCFTGESPMELSISFRRARVALDKRKELIGTIVHDIGPAMGTVVKVEGCTGDGEAVLAQ